VNGWLPARLREEMIWNSTANLTALPGEVSLSNARKRSRLAPYEANGKININYSYN
jgi:hypothetical protein